MTVSTPAQPTIVSQAVSNSRQTDLLHSLVVGVAERGPGVRDERPQGITSLIHVVDRPLVHVVAREGPEETGVHMDHQLDLELGDN